MRLTLLTLVFLTACSPPKHDWIIDPGVRVGPITASTSAADLRKAFGLSAVTDKDIDIGEGMTEHGTIVYDNFPGKSLAILWNGKNPARIMICYQQLQGDCLWKTSTGLGINATLKDLEQRNGRPFKLYGFGWDYSGTIISFEGGNLTPLAKGGLILRLLPDEAGTAANEYQTVLGESEFSSDNPAMQKLNPRVNSMDLTFRP